MEIRAIRGQLSLARVRLGIGKGIGRLFVSECSKSVELVEDAVHSVGATFGGAKGDDGRAQDMLVVLAAQVV